MKWAQSLMRISDHQIDGLRRRMAEIEVRRVACEMRLESLDREAANETVHAREHAEAGFYLVGFREGVKLRREKLLAELKGIDVEARGCRDALTEAYEEQKKVEQVAESARLAGLKLEAARETAALDEIALRRAVGR